LIGSAANAGSAAAVSARVTQNTFCFAMSVLPGWALFAP
jgi:hypothetical protein